MSRPLSFLLSFFLTFSALASPILLGTESPLGNPQLGAAASDQFSPSVAWNGRSGLVVWIDNRGRYPADTYYVRHDATRYLRVSPMRADGSLVNPEGTPLVPAIEARVATNGSSFLVVYCDVHGTYALPLDENGTPAGSSLPLTSFFNYGFDLLSNGHSFLFLIRGSTNEVAMLLGPSGVPSSTILLSSGAMPASLPAATLSGNEYAIAYRTAPCPSLPCTEDVHLARIADGGTYSDKAIIMGTDTGSALSLSSSENRLLLEILGYDGVRTLITDFAGNVIAPLKTITTESLALEGKVASYWDGQRFLVTWPVAPLATETILDTRVKAIRVSDSNEIVDAEPAVLATGDPFDLTLTRTDGRIAMFWVSESDVFHRTVSSTAELFTQQSLKEPAVFSVRAQSQIALAQNGSDAIRVWREGSLDSHVMLSIAGKTIEVAASTDRDLLDPSVARGGNVVLVFWRDMEKLSYPVISFAGYRTYARRFTGSGTAIDAAPILVSRNDSDYVDRELGTTVAFDGTNFIALWSGSSWSGTALQPTIRAARVSPNGTVLDMTPAFLQAPVELGFSSGLHAAWTGSDLLVTWSNWNDYRGILISPPPPPRTAQIVARIDTAAMKVIDSRAFWNDIGLSKSASLSWNGSAALITAVHSGCIEATLVDASLHTLQDRMNIECVSSYPGIASPSGAWNGNEYVLTWAVNRPAGDMIRAMRFDRELTPIDEAPSDLVAGYEPVSMGTELAYVRIDFDVPRAFRRTIERIAATGRGRAAGH